MSAFVGPRRRPSITYQTLDGRTLTVDARLAGQNGYAGSPGRGPQGQTCGTCHWHSALAYHNKRYHKCELVNWTHGAGTDIRVSTPACQHWEQA